MSNCSDIITTCTIAAASNSGGPYSAMKSAILDYTQKPKWSCYMDLHSLPPQGDIRPSQLMAKLTNTLPHGTPTNTDLFYSFFMFKCLSTSAKCWPRTSTPPPATWPSPPTASGTCANRLPPPPSPQPTDPASGPRRRARRSRNADRGRDFGRDSDRGRSQSQHRGRAQTPHDQEFPDNGICWYHNKYQNRSKRCRQPCIWNGPDARAGNDESSP
jgi:hypothetical protein